MHHTYRREVDERVPERRVTEATVEPDRVQVAVAAAGRAPVDRDGLATDSLGELGVE
jgi:hypothetical protein